MGVSRAKAGARGTAFVGRNSELAFLIGAMDDARAGRSTTCLILGEPGAGKTRLMDQAARLAAERGFLILRGAAGEDDGAPGHWPWIQILRGLPGADRSATSLAALLTPGEANAAPLTIFASSDAAELRFQLFDGLSNHLGQASARTPLFIALDDLHDADPASLPLFRFLASDVRPAHWVLVATWRDPEPQLRSAAHADFLGKVARHAQTVRLGGLAEAEVEDLARDLAGARVPAGLGAALHRATAGNPLYVAELMRGALGEGPRGLEALAAGHFTAARLGLAIAERLRPLGPAARRVLQIAAVIGREFSLARLQHVATSPSERLTVETLLGAMSELEAALLVRRLRDSHARYAFHHPLAREQVYDEIAAGDRCELHARVADALVAAAALGEGVPAGEIAHHLLCALPKGDPTRAIAACRDAGRRAATVFAYDEAAGHYASALRVARESIPGNDDLQLDILLPLGEAQIRAGERVQAMQSYAAAAIVARRIDRWTALADAALGAGDRGLGLTIGQADPDLLALLEEALRSAPEGEGARRARLRARLAAELSGAPEDRGAMGLVLAAEREARTLGDPATLAYVLSYRCFVPWRRYDPAPRAGIAAEIIQLGQTLRDREWEGQGRNWLLAELIVAGDRRRFQSGLEAFRDFVTHFPRPRYQWIALSVGALGELWRGHWQRAEELAFEGLALGQRIGDEQIPAAAWLQSFVARRQRGLRDEDEAGLRLAAAHAPHSPVPRALLAVCLADLGRDEEARAEFESLAVDDFADLERDHRIGIVPYLAEVCARVGDPRRAAILTRLLRPLTGRNTSIGNIVAFGAAEHYLALLATVRGDDAEAAALFERALERNAAMEGDAWRARTCLEQGRFLLRRDERARAAEILDEAADVALRLGMERVRADALEARSRLRPTPASEIARTHFFREGEVWSVGSPPRLIKDSVGMRHLARLLRQPGVAFLAVELAAEASGASRAGSIEGLSLRRAQDEDPGRIAIDARAVREYRERLSAARRELEEAESFHDLGRSAQLRTEIEQLAGELTQVAGFGRGRLAAGATDRPRAAVTRAVRAAIARVAKVDPDLGRYLDSTIRTGTCCVYVRDPRFAVVWRLD